MNSNLIPAAKSFNCTHGRVGVFLLRLERTPSLWHWHMVFAGHPDVCPEHLQEVLSSPQGFVTAEICRVAAEQQAYAITAAHEQWYFANRSLLKTA